MFKMSTTAVPIINPPFEGGGSKHMCLPKERLLQNVMPRSRILSTIVRKAPSKD